LQSAIVKDATRENDIASDDPRRRGSQWQPNDRQITPTIKLFALPDRAPIVPFVRYRTGGFWPKHQFWFTARPSPLLETAAIFNDYM
jgi:hypothetical protein